jgi:hypothetical protein
MFHGFDFDMTMLRIGSMNMTLHGVENPDVSSATALPKTIRRTRERILSFWRIHRSPDRSIMRPAPRISRRS